MSSPLVPTNSTDARSDDPSGELGADLIGEDKRAPSLLRDDDRPK
jgi:hypothetical protein